MIHVNSVTAAVYGLLAADPVLTASGFTIQEGEAFNRDLNHTPWVGIYYGHLAVDPRTLGGVSPWEGNLELFLYVQEGSHRSGREATRLLSQAQGAVLSVLDANKTLGASVLMINGIEVTPFQRDLAEDTWLFTNEISLRTTLRG
jgi:hypothetical protein